MLRPAIALRISLTCSHGKASFCREKPLHRPRHCIDGGQQTAPSTSSLTCLCAWKKYQDMVPRLQLSTDCFAVIVGLLFELSLPQFLMRSLACFFETVVELDKVPVSGADILVQPVVRPKLPQDRHWSTNVPTINQLK